MDGRPIIDVTEPGIYADDTGESTPGFPPKPRLKPGEMGQERIFGRLYVESPKPSDPEDRQWVRMMKRAPMLMYSTSYLEAGVKR